MPVLDQWISARPGRGLVSLELDLVGFAERLADGDELALVIFGYHLQFFAGTTRDPSLPAVSNSSGAVLYRYNSLIAMAA